MDKAYNFWYNSNNTSYILGLRVMMHEFRIVLKVYFYRELSGKEPVRECLKNLEKEDRKNIGDDIKTVQYGWPLGMPLVDSLGKGLWEVRSKLDNRIERIIFTISAGQMILLHAFIKKTQKTPASELEIAQKRAKNLDLGGN